jgi:hypothetical protein
MLCLLIGSFSAVIRLWEAIIARLTNKRNGGNYTRKEGRVQKWKNWFRKTVFMWRGGKNDRGNDNKYITQTVIYHVQYTDGTVV